MLTFAEEFLLLAHDEKSGDFAEVGFSVMSAALAGAAIMDLALLNRIDTDLSQLVLINLAKTGEPILDFCLARIGASDENGKAEDWVDELSKDGEALRDMVLDRLVERGILRRDNKRFLWVFNSRVYPLIDNRETVEVKRRLSNILFSEEIPNPRDNFLIALADGSDLLSSVFNPDEVDRRRERIKGIVRLDMLGQAVCDYVRDTLNAPLIPPPGL
jgi:golgi phosphoprotein 3